MRVLFWGKEWKLARTQISGYNSVTQNTSSFTFPSVLYFGLPHSEEKQEYIIPRPKGHQKWSDVYFFFIALEAKLMSAMTFRINLEACFNYTKIPELPVTCMLSLSCIWFFMLKIYFCIEHTRLVQSSCAVRKWSHPQNGSLDYFCIHGVLYMRGNIRLQKSFWYYWTCCTAAGRISSLKTKNVPVICKYIAESLVVGSQKGK